VESLSRQEHVVIVCGHYEGIDERFVEQAVDIEVSIGDCVLTGGEIPAMALIDAVSRLIPGVVGKSEAVAKDSFYRGMLDYPHYTRPASWKGRDGKGRDVPDVLLSGDAAQIEEWRRGQAVARTLSRRPDLLSRSGLGGYLRGGFYIAVEGIFADPDPDTDIERIREWADLCEGYGAVLLLVLPAGDSEGGKRREEIRQKLESAGVRKPGRVKLLPSFDHMLKWVVEKEKKKGRPLLVGVSDECGCDGARHWLDLKRFILEEGRPAVFCFHSRSRVFSAGGDLEEEDGKTGKNIDRCDARMIPLQEGRLPLGGEIAAVLDRFLGSR
jgi:tRNA (guanine37-N1)-methyltransferase